MAAMFIDVSGCGMCVQMQKWVICYRAHLIIFALSRIRKLCYGDFMDIIIVVNTETLLVCTLSYSASVACFIHVRLREGMHFIPLQ